LNSPEINGRKERGTQIFMMVMIDPDFKLVDFK
jgi:hypothetical protein